MGYAVFATLIIPVVILGIAYWRKIKNFDDYHPDWREW